MLDVNIRKSGDITTVAISGDLTFSTVGEFVGRVKKHKNVGAMEIAIEELGELDLAGLQALYALRKTRMNSEKTLRFSGEDALQRIDRMTEFAGLPQLREE